MWNPAGSTARASLRRGKGNRVGHEQEHVIDPTSGAPSDSAPHLGAGSGVLLREVVRATRASLLPRHDELLRDLALFRGPFPLAAASALSARAPGEILRDLEALVGARLLEASHEAGTGREYRMPRAVREAVTEEAAAGGAVAPTLARYLRAIARASAATASDGFDPPTGSGRAPSSGSARAREPRGEPLPGITARERDVLVLVARGLTNGEIAMSLGLSVKTVMHHSTAIYRKLGVRGRAGATAYAYRAGLVGGESQTQ